MYYILNFRYVAILICLIKKKEANEMDSIMKAREPSNRCISMIPVFKKEVSSVGTV